MAISLPAPHMPQPWYREPWPWYLMAGPATVIVAGAFTTWLAISTSDGLVADDYYKRGLAINSVLKREEAAARRGISADVQRGNGELVVRLSNAQPEALFVTLAHATRAGYDVRLRLARGADGVANIAMVSAAGARAIVHSDDPSGSQRLNQDAAKAFLKWVHQEANYRKFFESQKGFATPCTEMWEKDKLWDVDPVMAPFKVAARLGQTPGFAGLPNQKAAEVLSKYIVTDMYAKAVQGMPAEEAVKWAEGEMKKIYST